MLRLLKDHGILRTKKKKTETKAGGKAEKNRTREEEE
jgi:hypothetical protein